MSDTVAVMAGWHPDPFRRHELRFHDGALWTEHVADRSVPGLDTVPVADGPRSRPPDRTAGVEAPPVDDREPARVVPEVASQAGDLFGARVLLVDEAPLGVAGTHGLECTVRNQHHQRIAIVRTRREALGRKALRLLTSDTHREVACVEVLDPEGQTLLTLRRPARLLTPRITVTHGDGNVLGKIVPRQRFSRLCFTLEADERVLGTVDGQGPLDHDVRISDHTGVLVARVSRTWEVLSASHHPSPHTHLVEVLRGLDEPLHSLTLAAVLGLETMLVQDAVAVG